MQQYEVICNDYDDAYAVDGDVALIDEGRLEFYAMNKVGERKLTACFPSGMWNGFRACEDE